MVEEMRYQCNKCGDEYTDGAAGSACPDQSCDGVLGEIVVTVPDGPLCVVCDTCFTGHLVVHGWKSGDPCSTKGCGHLTTGVKSVDVVDVKPRRTRKTNPLRWARHLPEDAERAKAKVWSHLLNDPQLFGPEHPTPTAAEEWLSRNGEDGFIYTMVRITKRDIVCRVTRQMTLLQRGEDEDQYVTIGKAVLS